MKKLLILFLAIVIFVVTVSLLFYKEKEPIKIGFVGALTGKYSVLGNAMVNGVLLAFEEANYEVNGRKIDIVFKDDKQDEDLNKNIINEFLANDIKIIIGNVTSSMSKVTMSIINNYDDMFMISASSASNEFSGKDDNFFRVHVANNAQRFDSFTNYVINNGFKKIYGIYDPYNATYAKDYLINFEKSLVSKGEKPLLSYSKTNSNLDFLVDDIRKKNPDLIIICANSVDSARVIQYIRLKGLKTQVASAEWARTPSFIENAGKAAEGVIFNIDYDENSASPSYKEFVHNYKRKYDISPSMYASKAYEIGKILLEVLEKGDETQIKRNLLLQKEFEGVQDKILFDEYGDVIRSYYNFKVKNGEFVKVDE
ncbi:ABC transporter substrate-binding protein [Halarcobacter sp.]|uniref:ABC transporter substrate-binding protein n=1 Tax=Halarcobacter sp. TaxID=2321133 RepID=UPI003A91B801